MHDPRENEMARIMAAVIRMAERLDGHYVVDEGRKRDFAANRSHSKANASRQSASVTANEADIARLNVTV